MNACGPGLALALALTLPPRQRARPPQGAPPGYHFICECFFMTLKSLHLGLAKVADDYITFGQVRWRGVVRAGVVWCAQCAGAMWCTLVQCAGAACCGALHSASAAAAAAAVCPPPNAVHSCRDCTRAHAVPCPALQAHAPACAAHRAQSIGHLQERVQELEQEATM